MIQILALFVIRQLPAGVDVDSKGGLKVRVMGIPIVANSTVQYYEDGWKKGYYSSSYDNTAGRQVDSDTFQQNLSGANGLVSGKVTTHRSGNRIHVSYDLHWNGDKPAKIELNAGWLSAQVLQSGTLLIDGKPARSLAPTKYLPIPGISERAYTTSGTQYQFETPLTQINIKTSLPSTMFDARGYDDDFAKENSVFWLGELGLDVSKDKPVSFDIDWEFTPKSAPNPKIGKVEVQSVASPNVYIPNGLPPLIVPKPSHNELKYDKPLTLGNQFDYPAGYVRFWEQDFLGGLKRRFEIPASKKASPVIHVDGGVSKLGFHPGGYQITIKPDSISVLGEEDAGLHNGLRRLAELAVPHNGAIELPTGYLSSNPQLKWRGVHLFVGPGSLAFHKKLMENVLLPMGFNKVVLQCERTQWDCMPNLKGVAGMMQKKELIDLVSDYRNAGIEPIPLIQSFGHMQWLFQGGANLDLAVNSQVPYSIDPRNPKSAELLGKIWDEAIEIFKPSMIHFGCDEVNLLGFPRDDTALVSDLWSLQMPILKQIADKHQVKPMFWGDMALAPTEAIDAANGVSLEEAAKRRAVIPKGAWIADWHYKSDSKIENFLPSFETWKREGFTPIASAWSRPENVRSMDLAADIEKTGSLQTTWCGYSITEKTLIDNFNQFSAMILAGDYSWSARYDSIAKLDYDQSAIFRDLYFRQPQPLTAKPGTEIYAGSSKESINVRGVHFHLGDAIGLRSLISAPEKQTSIEMSTVAKGRHLGIVLEALDHCPDGELLGEIKVQGKGSKPEVSFPLRYGREVRARDDLAPMVLADQVNGYSILNLGLPIGFEASSIRIDTKSNEGGLVFRGFVIW